MDTSLCPSPAQRVLMSYIGRGEVARVYHARAGWAVRITTVRTRGAGGGLGRKVDAATRVLAELGWAYEDVHDRRVGYVWRLTDAGRSRLQGGWAVARPSPGTVLPAAPTCARGSEPRPHRHPPTARALPAAAPPAHSSPPPYTPHNDIPM